MCARRICRKNALLSNFSWPSFSKEKGSFSSLSRGMRHWYKAHRPSHEGIIFYEFFKEEGPWIHAKGEPILGGNIVLDFPSVGATENIVLASVLANGITRLENAAMEPEITELCCFLTKAGAKIQGIGTSVLEIQ